MAYLAGLFDGEGCITYDSGPNIEKEMPTSSGTYELR